MAVQKKAGLFYMIFRILRNYLIFLAIVFVFFYFMLIRGMRADEVELTSFVNMHISEVQKIVRKTDLELNIVRQYSNKVEKDKVISQWPQAGMRIKNTGQRKITLYVSDGPEIVTMPNVANIQYTEALNILRDLQMRHINLTLNVREPVRVFNATVPEGYVISQTPAPGETISSNSTITLVISSGKETVLTELPNLIGMNIQEAERKVNDLRLICETAPLYNIHRPPNVVLKQEPNAGEKMQEYARVKLFYNSITTEQLQALPKTVNYTYTTPNYVGARRVSIVLEDEVNEKIIYNNIEPAGKSLLLKLSYPHVLGFRVKPCQGIL